MAIYRRIVLKLSGESLSANGNGCYDAGRVDAVGGMIRSLADAGVESAVVIGGGNIWRGRFTDAMNPVNADQMGMLATVINALCVQDALERLSVRARVFTAQEMNRFTELYTARAADECLKSGGVALLAGGSGHPFFTTDTTAVLRAAELSADALLKGTTVEGIYDRDPNAHSDAKLLTDISYEGALNAKLNVMDMTAFTLCIQQKIPVVRVFSMNDLDNVIRVVNGENIGSLIHP